MSMNFHHLLIAAVLCAVASAGTRVLYKGGPIMNTDPNGAKIYVIWYGNWPAAHPDAIPIVEAFYKGYANTERFGINRLYADNTGMPVPPKLQWGGSAFDEAMVLGPILPDLVSVPTIIEAQIAAGTVQRDTNAIYMIWLGENVSLGWDCHCQAFHTYFIDSYGNRLKYNLMPFFTRVAPRTYQSSFPGIPFGPPYLNDEPVTMAIIKSAAHELDDTLVDPENTGWYNTAGSYWEMNDECAGTYTQPWPYTSPNGVPYNLRIGDYYFITHMRLFNFGKSPYCVQSVPTDAQFAPDGNSSRMRGDAMLRGGGKFR